MKYHISPKTGNPNQCKASTGACPFGNPEDPSVNHYDSKEEAREAFEKQMESGEVPEYIAKELSAEERQALAEKVAKRKAGREERRKREERERKTVEAASKMEEIFKQNAAQKKSKATGEGLAKHAVRRNQVLKAYNQNLESFKKNQHLNAKFLDSLSVVMTSPPEEALDKVLDIQHGIYQAQRELAQELAKQAEELQKLGTRFRQDDMVGYWAERYHHNALMENGFAFLKNVDREAATSAEFEHEVHTQGQTWADDVLLAYPEQYNPETVDSVKATALRLGKILFKTHLRENDRRVAAEMRAYEARQERARREREAEEAKAVRKAKRNPFRRKKD